MGSVSMRRTINRHKVGWINHGHKRSTTGVVCNSTDPPSRTQVQHSFRSLCRSPHTHTRVLSLLPTSDPSQKCVRRSSRYGRHHVLHTHQRVMVPPASQRSSALLRQWEASNGWMELWLHRSYEFPPLALSLRIGNGYVLSSLMSSPHQRQRYTSTFFLLYKH
jgi:hypothetical protein